MSSAVTTMWHTNLPGSDVTKRLNGEKSSFSKQTWLAEMPAGLVLRLHSRVF